MLTNDGSDKITFYINLHLSRESTLVTYRKISYIAYK